jgi:PPM family protein phosphatase
MRLIAAALTDVGNRRSNNEDAFGLHEDLGLFVVADGMGGHSCGEIASAMAVESILDFYRHARVDEESTWPYPYDDKFSFTSNKLKTAIAIANDKIHGFAQEHPESRGMGTTVVATALNGPTLSIAYVGDSRAYLFRDGSLQLLTSDHSWVNEQVRLGHLSGEEAARHPFRNVITKALGTRDEAQPDLIEMTLKAGDLILLCTDGLNSMTDDAHIAAAATAEPDPHILCRKLIDLANESGGEDNITVIALKMVG